MTKAYKRYLNELVKRHEQIYRNGIMFLDNPETGMIVEKIDVHQDHLSIYLTEVDNIMIHHLPFSEPPSLINIYDNGDVDIYNINDMTGALISFKIPYREYLYIENVNDKSRSAVEYFNITTKEIPLHTIQSSDGYDLLKAYPILDTKTEYISDKDNSIMSYIYGYFNPFDIKKKFITCVGPTCTFDVEYHQKKVDLEMAKIRRIKTLNLIRGSIIVIHAKDSTGSLFYTVAQVQQMYEDHVDVKALASNAMCDSTFELGYDDFISTTDEWVDIYPPYTLVVSTNNGGDILNYDQSTVVGEKSRLNLLVKEFTNLTIKQDFGTMFKCNDDN